MYCRRQLMLHLPPDRDSEVLVSAVVDRDRAEGAELQHPVVPEVHEGVVPKLSLQCERLLFDLLLIA